MGALRIGAFEFFILVAVFFIGTASMLVPVFGLSEQDMWLAVSTGWAAGIGYALFLSYCKVPQGRYPLPRIILSLYALHLAALVTRSPGDYINMTVMPKAVKLLQLNLPQAGIFSPPFILVGG